MRLGAEFPGTPSRTTDSNLDCVFVQITFVFLFPTIGVPLGPLSDSPEYWVCVVIAGYHQFGKYGGCW